MYYFRFSIPVGISYSPNWFGTMPKCPKGVKVLLYNDREGYGIARTEDKFKPSEVIVTDEAEALGTLTEVALKNVKEGVYFGNKLLHRWDEEVRLG